MGDRRRPAEELAHDSIGFVDALVIGLNPTSPAYSLAAVIGPIVALVGVAAPGVLLAWFVPMLLIASAFYFMNRVDPDCGTTFSWVTRAMGPWWGWQGGWAITMTGVLVRRHQPHQRKRAVRLPDGAVTPHRVLLRPDRRDVRDLLPPAPHHQPSQPGAHRHWSGRGGGVARLAARLSTSRHVGPGEFVQRAGVVRCGAAAGDRHRHLRRRRRAHDRLACRRRRSGRSGGSVLDPRHLPGAKTTA